jgi:hypothetical protein
MWQEEQDPDPDSKILYTTLKITASIEKRPLKMKFRTSAGDLDPEDQYVFGPPGPVSQR